VLDFISRDLSALLPGERVNLAWDLRALTVYARNWRFEWKAADPMPQVDVQALQHELAEGIKAILPSYNSPPMPMRVLPSRWPRPIEATATIVSKAEPQSKGRRYWIVWEGKDQEAIVTAVWNIIMDVGDKLRACAKCGSPFVAVRRQEYCSPLCSQRTRIGRRPRKTGRRRKLPVGR
jgi:hypothetical protein